jgi:hypothetical protein
MGLVQRYAHAAGSGNLKNDALHHAPDVLAAVALSSDYGGMLFRAKYQNDLAAYQRLLHHWTWIVSCKALRRSWPEHIPINKVALISLNRWISNVCPACTGRRLETIFNTPHLSDKACRLCDGSGEAPLRVDERWRDYVLDMIEELTADEYKAAARAAKKLGRDAG